MTWNEAVEAAKSQTGSWRLPTLKELEGLAEKDKRPTINQSVFVKTPQTGFWSSSLCDSDNNHVYTVDFSNGYSHYNHVDQSYAVRLVREKANPLGVLINLFKLLVAV